MPWILWSREAVRQLIVDKFQIELSISSVSRLLKKWGFTPQKPIYRAYERNPKAIARWMTEEYPKIHRQAKKEKAEICWCDEMGVRSDDQVGRSFGRRGQTPVIAASGKRFKCNMISAITNAGNSRFMVYLEDFGVNVFIDFLRRLIMKAPRKIFLITDNHRVHHARKVHQWLAKHTDKIAIFYLPAYAPELNPDELYNQDVKANTIKRQRPQNAGELKSLLRSYANSVQKKPAKIRNFFDASGLAYIRLAEAA
jgi:hypothetical protein